MWEWRCFVEVPVDAPSSRTAAAQSPTTWSDERRRDVYFPASARAGLKLRDSRPPLEVKLRTARDEVGAECWTRPSAPPNAYDDDDALALDAVRAALEMPDLFALSDFDCRRVRVECDKRRTRTPSGERADVVFDVSVDGVPRLRERYASLSVEADTVEAVHRGLAEVFSSSSTVCSPAGLDLAPVLGAETGLPELSKTKTKVLVMGYPELVLDLARRALQQSR